MIRDGEPPAGEFHFTSESVTEGHPDKMADQISDTILDAILSQDPHGRVACETFVTTGLALVGGEITTSATGQSPDIAQGVDVSYEAQREPVDDDRSTSSGPATRE